MEGGNKEIATNVFDTIFFISVGIFRSERR